MTITTVSTTSVALAALAKAQAGDRILFAPGVYEPLVLKGIKFPAPGVTLEAVDATNRPVIAGLEAYDTDGVAFINLDWIPAVRTQRVAIVQRCNRMTFTGGKANDPTKAKQGGFLFRDSFDCAVTGMDLGNLGTMVQLASGARHDVRNNRFHDVLGDGFQSSGASFVNLVGNSFTDFYPTAGDHPDAIQFYTLNTTAATVGIAIRDNIFLRGKGQAVQCFFFSNEAKIPFQNVEISGNAAVGCMWNAVAIYLVDGLTVNGNFVQGFDEPALGTQNMKGAWISLQGATNAKANNNLATGLRLGAATGVGNVLIAPAQPGDYSAYQAWRAAQQMPPASPPPLDPNLAKIAALEALTAKLQAELVAEQLDDQGMLDKIAALESTNLALTDLLANVNAAKKAGDAQAALVFLDRDDDRVGMREAQAVLQGRLDTIA